MNRDADHELTSLRIAAVTIGETNEVRRWPGPDLVRAAAALLVVYLHAAAAYLVHPMPGLRWAVADTSSAGVTAAFWSIELFIMPLFLILAGYFAYRSLLSGGGRSLIASRARRLLVPFAVAAVVVLPLSYRLWVVGWVIQGDLSADYLWQMKVPADRRENLYGTGHLWFLPYVFLYCGVLAVADRLGWVRHAEHCRGRVSMRAVAIAAIAGGIGVLTAAPEVVFGFQHAFLPVPSKWLYSGTFFCGGVLIAIADPQRLRIRAALPRLAGLGVASGIGAVALGWWAVERLAPGTADYSIIGLGTRLCLATITVLAAWTLSLAIVAAADAAAPRLSRFPRVDAVVAWTAAASFWIYLVHHPLVALWQIDLLWLAPNLGGGPKSLIVAAGSTASALGTYALGRRWRKRSRHEMQASRPSSSPKCPAGLQAIHSRAA